MRPNSVGDRRKRAVWLPAVWVGVQVSERLGQTPALRARYGATVLVPSLLLQGLAKGHTQDSRGIETHCSLVTFRIKYNTSKYTKTQLPSGIYSSFYHITITVSSTIWPFYPLIW